MIRRFPSLAGLLQVLAVLLLASAPALAGGWQVGDKVQGYDVDWYDATILEAGTGDHSGEYLVKYDKYSGEKWLSAESIRARPGAPPAEGAATGLQPGRYACYGYPGPGGAFRWYLDIGEATYQQRTPDLPAGHYVHDAAADALMFTDGPYAANGWFGR
ncbi:MAG: hypothetical protein ABUU24_04725, partial [Variovorax sp.]